MAALKDQPVFPGHAVRTEPQPVRIHIPGQPGSQPAQVSVNRVQGIIRSIDIVCSCGQVTRIHCQYESP